MKLKKVLITLLFTTTIFTINCEKLSNYADAPVNPDKQELLRLVNKVRSSGCNCGGTYYPPAQKVVWNDLLEKAAQNHSDDMDAHNKLDHTGSNGSSAGDRITAVGYSWTTYGENIAVGYPTEEAVIKGWLKSPGHCRNIMNAKVKEMGVATKGAYWTQVFAKH